MLVCRAGDAGAGCEGDSSSVGVTAVLDQRGSVKEVIPSDLIPGMGCSLGKSRERGYKALAGRVPASRRGAA